MAVVGQLLVLVGVNNAGLTAGLASSQAQLKGFAGTAGAVGAVVRTAVVGAGIGAAVGLGLAANAAGDFEDAFAGVRKTVDEADLAAAGLTFETLAQQFRDMATEIPVSATELAAIGETAGALGIKADDIEEFTRTVALLGSTTDLSTGVAAESLGKVGTILGLTGQGFEDFADVLVNLGNKGASTESEIIEITKRFASAGLQSGLSVPQILAFSSAIASAGAEPEAAGSALSRLFGGMVLGAATGSKAGLAFAKTSGMAFGDWSKLVKTDTVGAMLLLLDSLGKLDKFGQVRALSAMGIKGVNLADAIRKLAGTYETNLIPALANAEDAQGALATEATKRFDTFNSKLSLLGNNFNELLITIGTPLLPPLTDFVASITEDIQTVAASIGGWVASGQQLVTTFTPVITTIVAKLQELWAIAQQVGTVIMDLATRVWEGGLNRVIGTASNLIGSVIDVLGGLVSAITENADVMNILRTTADLIGTGFGIVADAVDNTLTFLGDLGDAIRENEDAMNILRGIADFLATGFGLARDAISGIVGFLGDLVEEISSNEGVMDALRVVADGIGTGFSIAADAVSTLITKLQELVTFVVENRDTLVTIASFLPGGQGPGRLGTEIGTNVNNLITGGTERGGRTGRGPFRNSPLPSGLDLGDVRGGHGTQLNNTTHVYLDGQKVGEFVDKRLFSNASQANSGFAHGQLP